MAMSSLFAHCAIAIAMFGIAFGGGATPSPPPPTPPPPTNVPGPNHGQAFDAADYRKALNMGVGPIQRTGAGNSYPWERFEECTNERRVLLHSCTAGVRYEFDMDQSFRSKIRLGSVGNLDVLVRTPLIGITRVLHPDYSASSGSILLSYTRLDRSVTPLVVDHSTSGQGGYSVYRARIPTRVLLQLNLECSSDIEGQIEIFVRDSSASHNSASVAVPSAKAYGLCSSLEGPRHMGQQYIQKLRLRYFQTTDLAPPADLLTTPPPLFLMRGGCRLSRSTVTQVNADDHSWYSISSTDVSIVSPLPTEVPTVPPTGNGGSDVRKRQQPPANGISFENSLGAFSAGGMETELLFYIADAPVDQATYFLECDAELVSFANYSMASHLTRETVLTQFYLRRPLEYSQRVPIFRSFATNPIVSFTSLSAEDATGLRASRTFISPTIMSNGPLLDEVLVDYVLTFIDGTTGANTSIARVMSLASISSAGNVPYVFNEIGPVNMFVPLNPSIFCPVVLANGSASVLSNDMLEILDMKIFNPSGTQILYTQPSSSVISSPINSVLSLGAQEVMTYCKLEGTMLQSPLSIDKSRALAWTISANYADSHTFDALIVFQKTHYPSTVYNVMFEILAINMVTGTAYFYLPVASTTTAVSEFPVHKLSANLTSVGLCELFSYVQNFDIPGFCIRNLRVTDEATETYYIYSDEGQGYNPSFCTPFSTPDVQTLATLCATPAKRSILHNKPSHANKANTSSSSSASAPVVHTGEYHHPPEARGKKLLPGEVVSMPHTNKYAELKHASIKPQGRIGSRKRGVLPTVTTFGVPGFGKKKTNFPGATNGEYDTGIHASIISRTKKLLQDIFVANISNYECNVMASVDGGIAALHMRTFYTSCLDYYDDVTDPTTKNNTRLIVAANAPWRGTAIAVDPFANADLGIVMGAGNPDLLPVSMATWRTLVPLDMRKGVFTFASKAPSEVQPQPLSPYCFASTAHWLGPQNDGISATVDCVLEGGYEYPGNPHLSTCAFGIPVMQYDAFTGV